MNSIGERLRLTTWGESHGPAIGGVIDGFPSKVRIDFEAVKEQMARRRPSSDKPGSTARREPDEVRWLSGFTPDGVTLGTPIAFMIENRDTRPQDYAHLEHAYRPGHADKAYHDRYGIRDWRGGGRASARETACRVAAGALCRQMPQMRNIRINSQFTIHNSQFVGAASSPLSILHSPLNGDTVGGMVTCVIEGLRPGVGNPVYDKLSARLAFAMMSIPAARSFVIGDDPCCLGSEYIDEYGPDGQPLSNHTGGILGGISTGQPIVLRVGFRPIASMGRPLTGLTDDGRPVTLPPRGRHDITAVIRAVPVVEAMAALTVADLLL